MNAFFEILDQIAEFIWGYVGFVLIIFLGLYFAVSSRFYQVRKFPQILKSFLSGLGSRNSSGEGLHPIKVFFAAIGGCIGIGNIVGICTAVQIGGPGALFWTWIAGFLGMLLQYGEVFLGMKTRVKTPSGYSGGPMHFLPKAFKGKWAAIVVAGLLCVYGVEIFMFNVITESVSSNWNIAKPLAIVLLLGMTLFAAKGGVKRVSEICSTIIPLFIGVYVLMSLWVITQNIQLIPSIFKMIFTSAFTGKAAEGAFAGSSVMLAISMGLSRGAYAGDLGVGYTSVIHSESGETNPEKQAALTIIGIFFTIFLICTSSIFLILATGVWKESMDVTLMVQTALSSYFPYMDIFMPFFLLILGYSTIISYFVVGVKCSKFLSEKYGPILYYTYAFISLPLFSFVSPNQAFIVMSLAGAFLMIFNLLGLFILRKEIAFDTVKEISPKALKEI